MSRVVLAVPDGNTRRLELRERQLHSPGPGEVAVEVRAGGVNPADFKSIDRAPAEDGPIPVGFEAAGVVAAVGDGVSFAVGDEVIAYPVMGAYASELGLSSDLVQPKPTTLDFAQAANLLLVGATAAEMIHVVTPAQGETVVVHGASSATGASLLQQLGPLGLRVLGTASERNHDLVRSFGAEPVSYGPGLLERLRELAPDGVDLAFDCVGTEEALSASLELVADRRRIVTIVAREEASRSGVRFLDGRDPASLAYRNAQRQRLVDLAETGALTVPVARTLALAEAEEALVLLRGQHPNGKLALIP